MPAFSLPEDFIRAIIDVYGEDGAEWLENLPALLDDCARRWNLTIEPHFMPLNYNFVAPVILADGQHAVLKAGVPNEERQQEEDALRFFGGRGIVELLRADTARGVMLIEQLYPGRPLTDVADDDEATRLAARVMSALWQPLPTVHQFPSVADWGNGFAQLRARFDGATGPFEARLVEQAECLFGDLLASSAPPVLLHGDLHHQNILSAERAPWLALDPKGVAGEPVYEVGSLMRNPAPVVFSWPHPEQLLLRRATILAEVLGFERQRILEWSMPQAVLSAWWSYKMHGTGWEPMMVWSERIAHLL
ncbi:MAG TPA: aminoglycoside phosphotransferase family protein [Ktedonobacterales bacterium]